MDGAKRDAGHLLALDVSVSFGGVRALEAVSVEVGPGSTTGLIGPNGSGKTTLINAISGIQECTTRGISIDGTRIDGLPPFKRAAVGVARTFQAQRLFHSMSVMDNIMLGAHHLIRRPFYLGDVFRSRTYRAAVQTQRDRALEIMETFGERLTPRRNDPVMSLSYANRRRAEVCRAALASPAIMLLDEPTAGMNPHETEEFAHHLVEVRKVVGCSILVIEHKMDFVIGLCDKAYVLDHGVCIAEGPPDEVVQSPLVVEAYLGAT